MENHSFKIDRDGLIGFTQNLIQTPSLSMQEVDAAKALKESGAIFKKTFVMTAVVREEMAKGEGILRLLEQGEL